MPKKALASLNVVINAVTSPLFRGLAKASKRLTVFGAKMKAVGRSISMSFSLPFAAVGVAGAKMAIDFQKNMTKINTLVGISAKEVNNFSKDVMKLSGTTAQAPADLAEGLFFLTSAGLRGANAMETLEAVSKGTAIGLGEQADLAKVAAAAQNAYGKENLSAAQALDIFGGSVRAGMFEAQELAEVLGTELGMAAALGISFEEANAFIATYTKTTGDARSATTSFGGIMMSMAKMTPKMERALSKVGMSADSVKESLGEQGLMQTLVNLQTAFENNNVPISEFFGKSKALKGVFGNLGTMTETYAGVLGTLEDAAFDVNEGFDTVSETAGFKMQKSLTTLKNAAMELGAVMLPVFTAIVNGAVSLAKAFRDLDSGTQKIIVATATLVAFSGPLMTLAGGLVSVLGMVLSPIGLVVAGLAGLFYVIYDNWGTTKKYLVQFINYWIELYNESDLFRIGIQGIIATFKILWLTAKLNLQNIWTTMKALGSNAVTLFKGVGNSMKAMITKNPADLMVGIAQTNKALKGTLDDVFEGVTENTEKYAEDVANAWYDTVEAVSSKKKIKLIAEEDIQGTVDDVTGWLGKKLQAARDMMKGFMGGKTLLVPEGPEADPTGEPKDDGTEKVIEKKISLWQRFFDFMKNGYDGLVSKIENVWGEISNIASSALNGIGNLWAAQNEKEMTILENDKIASQEKFDEDYEREKKAVENAIMTKEGKEQAILALDKKFSDRQVALDEDMEEKKKGLQKTAAKREKAMKIAQAIMGTANAIVQALSLGPIAGPILAGVMGALGAAQIAAIASTPIPMAQGGLAFGPTNAIVGDNPNAANDPEVVAPLSKLKSMLGGEMNVALNVGGILKGNDIYLSNESTTDQRPRYI